MRKLLLVVAVAGCALETSGDVSTGEVEQALCPKFTCGGDNSPVTG